MLEVVERTLGAVEARVEIGGSPPTDPDLLWVAFATDMRLVARMAEPPADRDAAVEKLRELSLSFTETLDAALAPELAEQSPPNLPRRRLDDTLEALRAHVRARRVMVIDVQSPVLWGASDRDEDNDVDELEELGRALGRAEKRGIDIQGLLAIPAEELAQQLSHAGLLSAQVWALERATQALRDHVSAAERLLSARAAFEVRAAERARPGERTALHGTGIGLMARPFANIYRLVSVFDGAFSELHVESAMLQAVPTVEQLLFALPPVDPPPKAGRVLRLPTR